MPPRTLKAPSGVWFSCLTQTSLPTSDESCGQLNWGVAGRCFRPLSYGRDDRVETDLQPERNRLEEFERPAVGSEFQVAGDEPGLFEPRQVHVEQGAAHPDAPGEFAHVQRLVGEFGEDAQPLRAGDRREASAELVGIHSSVSSHMCKRNIAGRSRGRKLRSGVAAEGLRRLRP